MWAVAGNHDWYKGRDSIDTQVAYSEHSERWRMLGYDYAVPHLPEWLHIYGLDTVIIDNGVQMGQLDRANAALCDATGWKILFGHHAVFTSGHHANRNGVVPRVEQALVPLIETCGVDLLLSGHDHHQEHLIADGFHQIIQGAAGKLRSVGRRASDHEGDPGLFRRTIRLRHPPHPPRSDRRDLLWLRAGTARDVRGYLRDLHRGGRREGRAPYRISQSRSRSKVT